VFLWERANAEPGQSPNNQKRMKKLLAISFVLIAVVGFISFSILAHEKAAASPAANAGQAPAEELWRQVEIIRTAHGVPHIRAENLRAAGTRSHGCNQKTMDRAPR
jgi:hypothetical protein